PIRRTGTPVAMARRKFYEYLLAPLRCAGTELPEPVLLMAKLIVVCFLITREWQAFPDPFIPFLGFFDHFSGTPIFRWVLKLIFLGSATCLLFNFRVRLSCFVVGTTLLTAILSSRVYFQNNLLFVACLMVLAGSTERDQRPWVLQVQVSL